MFRSSAVKGEPEKTSDPRLWDPLYLKNVASKIAECYKDIYCKLPKRSPSNKEVIVVSVSFLAYFCYLLM